MFFENVARHFFRRCPSFLKTMGNEKLGYPQGRIKINNPLAYTAGGLFIFNPSYPHEREEVV